MRYSPHPNVVARRLDEAVVLVHLDTNRIFTLNPTGSRIWDLLTGPAKDQDVHALEHLLRAQYEVDDDEGLHGDVLDLLGRLAEERLVVGAEGDAPD